MIIPRAFWSPARMMMDWFYDDTVPKARKILGGPFVALFLIFWIIAYAVWAVWCLVMAGMLIWLFLEPWL